MEQILKLVWRYKYFIIVSIAILVSLAFTLEGGRQEEVQTEIAENGAEYENIIPGKDSEDELKQAFGNELSSENIGTQKINEYKSTSPTRNHQAIIEDGKVSLIKEIVSMSDSLTAKDFKDEYGESPVMLYDKTDPNSSFFLFVYPGRGLAYLGHNDGTLLEVWYFPPTVISDFINNWATSYSLEKPRPIQ